MKKIRIVGSTILLSASISNANAEGGGGKKWEFLGLNEPIEVIAPGFTPNEKYLEQAKMEIKKAEFDLRIPQDFLAPDPLGYSNTREKRAGHIMKALQDPSATVIWAARGGRGSSTLLPYLKNFQEPEKPKLIVGFSDITALHLWAASKNWPSLHGVVLAFNQECGHEVNAKESLLDILPILNGEYRQVDYEVTALNKPALIKHEDLIIHGKVVGGNLSLIQRSIGTETMLDTRGKIILLEDDGEAPTRVCEMFTQLDRSGMLDQPKAVLLGDFSAEYKPGEMEQWWRVREELAECLEKRNIPLLASNVFGHGEYNHPLPLNTPATLRWSTDGEEEEEGVKLEVNTNN